MPKAGPPLTVVPAGTVTGTLTSEPLLVTVTTPFCTVAETLLPVLAEAQAACSAITCASLTSVIWSSGAVLAYQVLYWDSMLLIRSRIV